MVVDQIRKLQTVKYKLDTSDPLCVCSITTRRGLWPQAAFWVLCLICDKQIVDIFEMYPQRAQRAGGISKGSL